MKKLGRKTRRQLQKLGVAIIYLYGSAALGRSSRLSDVDLGVVFKHSSLLRPDARRSQLSLELSRCLEPIVAPRGSRELDLVLLQAASPVLQFEAINAGRPLFVADRIFQADYEAAVLRDYLDVSPLVEAHYRAALERAA